MSVPTTLDEIALKAQPPRPRRNGLVLVNTGPGKGKTTAALGLAFRSLGWGWSVIMVQFVKGSWKTGEKRLADGLPLPFKILPMGGGCGLEESDKAAAKAKCANAWGVAKEALADDIHDLVILDELNIALAQGHLEPGEVVESVRARPRWKSVVITGRRAPREVIEVADIATEFKELKHPFSKGVMAQKGIEF